MASAPLLAPAEDWWLLADDGKSPMTAEIGLVAVHRLLFFADVLCNSTRLLCSARYSTRLPLLRESTPDVHIAEVSEV